MLDVIIPSKMPARDIRIAPRDHEDRQAVLDRKSDEGIGGLEVKYIELVDAGRHDQQRPRRHLLRRRIILNELKQIVFEDNGAPGCRDVFSNFECAFVGNR